MKEPDFSFSTGRAKPEYTFRKKAGAFFRGFFREGPLVEVAISSFGHAGNDRDAIAYDKRLDRLDDYALVRALMRDIDDEARGALSGRLVDRNFKEISLRMSGLSDITRRQLANMGGHASGRFLIPNVAISRPPHIERVRKLLEGLEAAGRADERIMEAVISIRSFGGIAERVWREHYYDESYGEGLYESLASK